ncbi:MAG: aspartyl protease family protein [Steroidobacteraceae bacterium]
MCRRIPQSFHSSWRCLALLLTSVAASAAEPIAETGSTDSLQEIIIVAPEPRYVAPTQRDRIGRVWVPVMLNGKGPFRLVLDSGATHSAVTAQVAAALGLSLTEHPPVLMRGVTGSAVTPSIRVASIEVGDLLVGSSVLPIVEDAFGGAEGLLGTEGMSDKRIYIDFRNDFINISKSDNRGPAAGFSAIPLRRDAGRLLVVRARVDGVRTRAIIDTGAQASIGNLALKEALSKQWRRRKETADLIIGATGATQPGQGMPISPIKMGDIKIRAAHVTFGEMAIFEHWNLKDEPTILIGMDILGLVEALVIDYKRKELHFRLRASGSPGRSR